MQTGIYQHYKGAFYQVLGVAGDATNEGSIEDPNPATRYMVVYLSFDLSLPGPRLRVRDINEFNALVKWPDGSTNPRFMPIGDELTPSLRQIFTS